MKKLSVVLILLHEYIKLILFPRHCVNNYPHAVELLPALTSEPPLVKSWFRFAAVRCRKAEID